MELSLLDRRWNCARDRIIAMRKAAGISQRDLAKALKCPRSLVSRIEQGERRVDLLEFLLICKALAADPAEQAALVMKAMSPAPKRARKRPPTPA